ncbi:MAG: hypothetical protein PHX06_05920, partial [Methanocorpusculum parvum]|nr:hypothetical protein [Methanocorpusculum sp.]MDD4424131.1 hypothetical protein [Methanocorpusculum parvum]
MNISLSRQIIGSFFLILGFVHWALLWTVIMMAECSFSLLCDTIPIWTLIWVIRFLVLVDFFGGLFYTYVAICLIIGR